MLRAANVSAVPQRSPFRYPGGKTPLIPLVRKWLQARGGSDVMLVEPFAGGGAVTLTAIMEDLTGTATMVELDEGVASVWRAILGRSGRTLAEQIRNFELDDEKVQAVLQVEPSSIRERAFQTLVKNRVNRNGILNSRAGMLKEGENGTGIGSRWYPDTISERIMKIVEVKDRITVKKGDGLRFLKTCLWREDCVYFIDPPYRNVGKRLYEHGEINNGRLFQRASLLYGDFLMTYDNTVQISELADKYGFQTEVIWMSGTADKPKTELLIGKDLSWLTDDASRRNGTVPSNRARIEKVRSSKEIAR